MIGMMLLAGLIWGVIFHPREVLAAWRRERDRERASREYRPTAPSYKPEEPKP